MEYLKQRFGYFTNYFVKRVEENKERKANKYDVYFEQIYRILSWEDATLTLVAFLVVHFLFWLIVQWQIKFFGLIFFTILVAFLWDIYSETTDLSLQRGKYLHTLHDIHTCVRDIMINLKVLRKESPSSFCIGMSLMFLSMSFIARNMSGYLISYLTILAIFFVPLIFKYLPEEYTENIKQMLKSCNTIKGVLAEEELIPFITNKEFTNKDNDLDSLLSDKTAESATNSLASGISQMPSYLDVTEIQQDIEEEDLFPRISQGTGISYTPGDLSSDSDDSEHRDIHFDAAHFSGDSSSDEEKMMGKGLKLPDSDKIAALQTPMGSILSNLAASVLKSTVMASIERNNSSSDSEFEIINSDDVRG